MVPFGKRNIESVRWKEEKVSGDQNTVEPANVTSYKERNDADKFSEYT